MKRLIAFLILLLVSATALLPCCTEDDCAADPITLTSQQNNGEQEEGTCSPFFSCTGCMGFIALEKPLQLPPPPAAVKRHHETVYTFLFPAYHSTFWQPPRVG